MLANTTVNYPDDYEGTLATDGSTIDYDEDGLSLLKELQQGTSDNYEDTDDDGINDLKESEWFIDRDEIFCDTNTTPHVCAYPDPVVQDIYIEIDWMQDGSRSYMPSSDQIEMIEYAFAAKDINLHVDTGEVGGGNVLPSYESELPFGSSLAVDFGDLRNGYDYNSANFSTNREGVWRYMISGYKYAEYPTSSGIAEVGGDNIFISYGLIEDSFSFSDFDKYLASTMLHEIGHNLCLSGTPKYSGQPSECIFAGIDSDNIQYEVYPSAMTYMNQGDIVDYSTGQGLLFDHNDWSAVKLEMGHFSSLYASPGVFQRPSGIINERRAIDIDLAAPNKMTPEMSKENYNRKEAAKRRINHIENNE